MRVMATLTLLLLLVPFTFATVAKIFIIVLIALLVLGFIYYAINKHAPEPIKGWSITIVVALAVLILIWVLFQFYNGGL